ncbi:XRE family transcriptional regulator [Vagococcus coleopterorum]|uniref:XRE family transcriptional regulator n=1 Tax=Vagococcus coleopterorum TaxID=2714946 RepID=A0A6G8AMR6_9ENTE|nr:XRE family transcriptional regulator [Vagococcus coleopterorum]QIL46242.1 XRE family transcriptional regulator [Vagococcus coleopterorum]
MTIYEKIKLLVSEKENLTVSKLEQELNFGSGTIRRWQETIPGVDKLLKVANYFEIPITLLLDDQKQFNLEAQYKPFTIEIAQLITQLSEADRQYLLKEMIEYGTFQKQKLKKK